MAGLTALFRHHAEVRGMTEFCERMRVRLGASGGPINFLGSIRNYIDSVTFAARARTRGRGQSLQNSRTNRGRNAGSVKPSGKKWIGVSGGSVR
jgi:hypothetical protein